MIRAFKILGPTLLAMLAMGIGASSPAQAAPEFIISGKATGSNVAGNETITTPGGTVQCDSHFTLEALGGGNIGGAAKEVTVTPKYDNCVAFGFIGASVHENLCDYIFTATEKVSAGVYKHHVKLDCPPLSPGIIITGGTCEVDIPEEGNSSLTTITTTNLANGTVTVQPEITSMKIVVTKDGFGCPFSGTGNTIASYHGHVVFARVGGGSVSVSGE